MRIPYRSYCETCKAWTNHLPYSCLACERKLIAKLDRKYPSYDEHGLLIKKGKQCKD